MWQGNVFSVSLCKGSHHTEPCSHSGQKCFLQQECIQEGCVPPAHWPTVSRSIEWGCAYHASPPLHTLHSHVSPCHAPPSHTTSCHACPPPCMPLPCTPPSTSPFTMQPPSPCTPVPPLWTEFLTQACKNITLPQVRCGS